MLSSEKEIKPVIGTVHIRKRKKDKYTVWQKEGEFLNSNIVHILL